MALNIGLEVSFDNIGDWRGMREGVREVNSRKAYRV
jgi:hypothetical protein